MKRFLALAALAGTLAVGAGCTGIAAAGGGTHTVTYKVEGSATGTDITFSTPDGGTSQASGKAVPLANHTTGTEGISGPFHSGAFLYISAQNTGESGDITCIIEVDGVAVKTSTSSGGFTIATCSGRL